MKALVNTGPRVMEYVTDWPKPEPGPDDLLVKVKTCAICGSDVHGYTGETGRRQPPIIMGHEAAGVVEAVGENVTDYAPGDRVCFDSTVYCLNCEYCYSGHFNMCANREVVGVSEGTYRRHGAMAEYVTVPHWIGVKLPDSVSFAQAALAETVSIGVHAANRTPIKLNDTVVVVGSGGIGLVTLQAIKAKGAGKTIVTDVFDSRLEMARSLGADVTINVGKADDPVAAILAETGPEGANAVIECVGLQATEEQALAVTRKAGQLTLVGNVTPKISFDLQSIVTREITINGSCATNGEFGDAVALIADGRMNVNPLISGFADLSEGQAVFDRLFAGDPTNIRTVFVFE